MPFDSVTINTYFELEGEDSEEYRALYQTLDYDCIFKTVIKGKFEWKRSISNQVQLFLKTGITETTKSWFYLFSSNLILTKHISTIQKDKSVLTYAIVSEMKFNVGLVIHKSILKSIYGKVITHPFLFIELCLRAGGYILKDEVPTHDFCTIPNRKERPLLREENKENKKMHESLRT